MATCDFDFEQANVSTQTGLGLDSAETLTNRSRLLSGGVGAHISDLIEMLHLIPHST